MTPLPPPQLSIYKVFMPNLYIFQDIAQINHNIYQNLTTT